MLQPPFADGRPAVHQAVEWAVPMHADQRRFGARVASIVAAVSEDPSIEDYVARKAALRSQACAGGIAARAVYAADKISKARELRAQAAHDPTVLKAPQNVLKLEHYEASLVALRAAGDAQPMVDQLAFELWALRALPPE